MRGFIKAEVLLAAGSLEGGGLEAPPLAGMGVLGVAGPPAVVLGKALTFCL